MTMTDWYLDHACLHISGGTHISQSACLPVHATQKVDKAKHTKTPYIAQQGVIMNCMFFILTSYYPSVFNFYRLDAASMNRPCSFHFIPLESHYFLSF